MSGAAVASFRRQRVLANPQTQHKPDVVALGIGHLLEVLGDVQHGAINRLCGRLRVPRPGYRGHAKIAWQHTAPPDATDTRHRDQHRNARGAMQECFQPRTSSSGPYTWIVGGGRCATWRQRNDDTLVWRVAGGTCVPRGVRAFFPAVGFAGQAAPLVSEDDVRLDTAQRWQRDASQSCVSFCQPGFAS